MSEEVSASMVLYEGASPEEARKFIKRVTEKIGRGRSLTEEEAMALLQANTIVRSVPYSPPQRSLHAEYSQEDLDRMAEIASARIEADAKTILLEREKKAREKDKIALQTRGITDEQVKEIVSPVEEKIKAAEAKVGAKRREKSFLVTIRGRKKSLRFPKEKNP